MKPLTANLSSTDQSITKIHWQATSRRVAESQFALLYDYIPPGYKEELTAHRTRKKHGQRRSCTMHIRKFDHSAESLTTQQLAEHFNDVLSSSVVVSHK